jgi:hypothetical protein
MSLDHATPTLAAFPDPAARLAAGSVVDTYIGRGFEFTTGPMLQCSNADCGGDDEQPI